MATGSADDLTLALRAAFPGVRNLVDDLPLPTPIPRRRVPVGRKLLRDGTVLEIVALVPEDDAAFYERLCADAVHFSIDLGFGRFHTFEAP